MESQMIENNHKTKNNQIKLKNKQKKEISKIKKNQKIKII